MKRRSPPEEFLIDVPPSPRRRRMLSAEERALWDSVAKQATPLRKKPRVAKPDVVVAAVAEPGVSEPVAPPRQPAQVNKPPSTPPLAPLSRRERSHLSRGRIEIDARLDLHGMTQARAHRALLQFLHRANHEGLRFVLVVTGKGRSAGPESERGILRRQVPEWLGQPEFRAFVVGFEEAHIGHGGAGALYVRVRRSR